MVGLQALLGPALSLSKFTVDPTATSGPVVVIEGRVSGLMGFIMAAIGLGAKSSIQVTSDAVSFKRDSLSGQMNHYASLSNIASTHCGFSRPIIYLALSFFLVSMSFSGLIDAVVQGASFFLLILAVAAFVAFVLGKRLYIYFQTNGGMIMGMRFRRSLIENVDVDIETTLNVIKTVNTKITEVHLVKR